MSANVQRVPVAQDKDRFKLLFTNSRPAMPKDCKESAAIRTTRELINIRLQSLSATMAAAH